MMHCLLTLNFLVIKSVVESLTERIPVLHRLLSRIIFDILEQIDNLNPENRGHSPDISDFAEKL